MKTLLETFAVAFSMYSALPVRNVRWNEKNMRYALCAFPFVGAVIGLIDFAFVYLTQALGMPAVIKGAGLCLIPVAVTGGIHLDGYADTCDALASHQDAQKKREILKDSHIGSFAVIRLCGYFVLSFALWTALPVYLPLTVGLGYCLSRALSGLAIVSFPLSGESGLASAFANAAERSRVKIILSVCAVLIFCAMALCGPCGMAMAVSAWLVYLYFRHMSESKFGGLSGDLSGWFLQTAELWMCAILCLSQYLLPGGYIWFL